MNKEKLMQFLSEAIDKGAHVSIHMMQFNEKFQPVSESEALHFANMFKEAVGAEKLTAKEHKGICNNFNVNEGFHQFSGCFSHSPDGYMIEDVRLDGEADAI